MTWKAVAVWFLILAAAFVNGLFRQSVLVPRIDDMAAHIISTLMLCTLILVLTRLTIRWMAPRSARAAIMIGLCWLLLTLLFEFGFGRYVEHKPWHELLADYNVMRGRTWPLVLVTTALAPLIVSKRVRDLES